MKTMRMVISAALVLLPAAVVSAVFFGQTVHAAGLAVPVGYRATVIPAAPAEVRRIKPGDRVDMLVTLTQSQDIGMTTASLLQSVLVLDVEYKSGISNLVLALNPNEAQFAMLSLSDKCRVNFVIRAKGDEELHPMEIASFKRLFGRTPEAAADEKKAVATPETPKK
ncbi:MAG: hypothetical protein HY952_01935 [Elusimicrobia bacterium]|nr:hypothetical protein [Elusimicrobiota bacterium]